MTARGVWTLIPALIGAIVGLITGNSAVSLLSLAVILWMITEWTWFQWRVLREFRSISVERRINQRGDAAGICHADRTMRISVTVHCHRGKLQPWTRIRDLVPDILTVIQGNPVQFVVSSEKQVTFNYRCQPQAAGTATMSGCLLRIQDPHGFFLSDRFVTAQQTIRILPSCESIADAHPQIKRLNCLPQHGSHRLQRAGMGSELLELREYVPGDPPKSIAWKVSARRDRLMTREYESEVAVRTIVFVDNSSRTRRGHRGSRLCDTSSRLAAGICKNAVNAGDPTGLVLFSESGAKRISPGRGDRTMFRVLEMLSESCHTDNGQLNWTVDLQKLAMDVCEERYPHLLDININRVPWTVFPILPWNRRVFHTRWRLSAILCQLYQLSIGDWSRLLNDDDFMGRHLSEFLTAHGRSPITYQSSTVEQQNSASLNETLRHLSISIQQTTAQARDNEHYLIVCDLLDAAPLLSTIRPVIQLARAAHHRLSFVCPAPSSHAISGNGNDPPTAPILLHEAWQIELQEKRDRLTRKLWSLGATVAFPDRDEPLSITLQNLNRRRRGRAATRDI